MISAMIQSVDLLRNELATFPPQPSRTRAKTFNTWVREIGRLPRVAFFTQSGARRKGNRIASGFTPDPPSQKLLAHWRDANAEIVIAGTQMTGRMSNPVTYGPFVEGDKQARPHQETGWPTIKSAELKYVNRIVELFAQAILNK